MLLVPTSQKFGESLIWLCLENRTPPNSYCQQCRCHELGYTLVLDKAMVLSSSFLLMTCIQSNSWWLEGTLSQVNPFISQPLLKKKNTFLGVKNSPSFIHCQAGRTMVILCTARFNLYKSISCSPKIQLPFLRRGIDIVDHAIGTDGEAGRFRHSHDGLPWYHHPLNERWDFPWDFPSHQPAIGYPPFLFETPICWSNELNILLVCWIMLDHLEANVVSL